MDERDKEIHALRRQVEQLTVQLNCLVNRSEHGSARGCESDESDEIKPFAQQRFRNEQLLRDAFSLSGWP